MIEKWLVKFKRYTVRLYTKVFSSEDLEAWRQRACYVQIAEGKKPVNREYYIWQNCLSKASED